MAIIRTRADAARTGIPGSVLGGISIASQVTAALGLPVGGWLTAAGVAWAVFAVNVPLGLIGVGLVLRWVPRDPPRTTRGAGSLVQALDPAGMALFAAAVISLIAAISDIRHVSWIALVVFVLSTTASSCGSFARSSRSSMCGCCDATTARADVIALAFPQAASMPACTRSAGSSGTAVAVLLLVLADPRVPRRGSGGRSGRSDDGCHRLDACDDLCLPL
jgi:hypothetical protein